MSRLEVINTRFLITGIIETLTPLHVGVGRGEKEIGEADLPIIKLPDGRPYVPGSSIKGCIRSEVDRLASSLGIRVCIYQRGRPIMPRYDCEYHNPCISCDIFGSTRMSSRIIIRDVLGLEKVEIPIRHGTPLQRDTKTVAPGMGFEIEYVSPGTKFNLEIVFENPEDWMLGLLFIAIESLPALGGQVSRGMGKVKFEIKRIEKWTAESIINQKTEEIIEGEKIKQFIENCKKSFREKVPELKKKYEELIYE